MTLQSPEAPKRKRLVTAGSSDEEAEYYENMLLQKKSNVEAALRIVPKNAPKLRTAPKRQKKSKGKENVPPVQQRIMPRRAAKQKRANDGVEVQNNINLEKSEESHQTDEDDINSGPIAPQSKKPVLVRTVGYFDRSKNHRLIGQVITKHTPLPEFPKKLQASLEKGIYNTQLMNSFLKTHIETITNDSKISKQEYQILAEQVTNRLQAMNVANAESYQIKIKKNLSDSLRCTRYYPKKRAKRATQNEKLKQTIEKGEGCVAGGSSAGQGSEGVDEADNILQRPVQNKSSVKMCISASTKRISFIQKNNVQEVLSKYPYLREADLLIYEYSCRVPLPLKKMEENFSNILLPLSHILNKPLPEPDDENGKIMLFYKIEEYFSGDEEHLPSIQFCDATNPNAVPLNEIPFGQAPALVITQDNTKIPSVSLIFDGSIITTLTNPSAFDSVALLMSGYWVFHINFPPAYMQHMETIEAILHGRVTQKARAVSRFPKMDQFFRKLIIALDT